jgi:hypothetical protein
MANSNNLYKASREWATRPQDQRFETLAALFDSVNSRRMRSRSSDISLAEVKASVAPDGEDIQFNHGLKAVAPTNWSFGQLSGWIGAPASYLRKLPAQLAVDCINNGIQNNATTALKFMSVIPQQPTAEYLTPKWSKLL